MAKRTLVNPNKTFLEVDYNKIYKRKKRIYNIENAVLLAITIISYTLIILAFLESSRVNVVWSGINFLIGFLLTLDRMNKGFRP